MGTKNPRIPEENPHPGRIDNDNWRAYWRQIGQGWSYQQVADDLGVSKRVAEDIIRHTRMMRIRLDKEDAVEGVLGDFDALFHRVTTEPVESWQSDWIRMRSTIRALQVESKMSRRS
jgi:DNA-directed RNA polymerase subunit N (RpoN/RPB10)